MTGKAPYRVRVWCRDCGDGQDPQGCFDGGADFLTDDGPPFDDVEFSTIDEAITAGRKATAGPPWEFDVIDADGDEVDRVGK